MRDVAAALVTPPARRNRSTIDQTTEIAKPLIFSRHCSGGCNGGVIPVDGLSPLAVVSLCHFIYQRLMLLTCLSGVARVMSTRYSGSISTS